MYILLSISCIGALFVTAILLRIYASWKNTPWYAFVGTAVGWFAAMTVTFMVPADFATTYIGTSDVAGKKFMLFVTWKIIYWTCFCLTWIISPFLQDYAESGGFTVWERTRASIRNNLLFYGLEASLAIIVVIFLLVRAEFTSGQIINSAAALANVAGLILMLLLSGYGLVDIPRRFWRAAQRTQLIRQCQYEAAEIMQARAAAEEEMEEAIKALEKVRSLLSPRDAELMSLASAISAKLPQTTIDDIETSRKAQRPRRSAQRPSREEPVMPFSLRNLMARIQGEDSAAAAEVKRDKHTDYESNGHVTRKDMIALNRRVMMAVAGKARQDFFWEELRQRYFRLQDEVQAAGGNSTKLRLYASSLQAPRTGRFGPMLDKLEWYWRVRFIPILYRIAAVFFALLSIAIVWSETTIVFTSPDLSFLSLIAKTSPALSETAVQFIVMIPICYLFACSTHTLFHLRIARFFALFHHGHSSAKSLLFSAAYIGRLAAPLSYNVLNLGRLVYPSPTVQTAFAKAVGDMSSVFAVLGSSFQYYASAALIVICLLTLFNVGARLSNSFTCCAPCQEFMFSDDFYDDKIEEGRHALDAERRAIERQSSRRREHTTELLPLKRHEQHTLAQEETISNDNVPLLDSRTLLNDNTAPAFPSLRIEGTIPHKWKR